MLDPETAIPAWETTDNDGGCNFDLRSKAFELMQCGGLTRGFTGPKSLSTRRKPAARPDRERVPEAAIWVGAC